MTAGIWPPVALWIALLMLFLLGYATVHAVLGDRERALSGLRLARMVLAGLLFWIAWNVDWS